MRPRTSINRFALLVLGFSLFLSWPYCAFFTSSLFILDVHEGALNNACWIVSLLFVSLVLLCLSKAGKRADVLLRLKRTRIVAVFSHVVANMLIIFGNMVPGVLGVVIIMSACAITGIATGVLHLCWGLRIAQEESHKVFHIVVVSHVLCFMEALVFSFLPPEARPFVVLIIIITAGAFLVAPLHGTKDESIRPTQDEAMDNSLPSLRTGKTQELPFKALSLRDYVTVFFCFVCFNFIDGFYQSRHMVDRDMYFLVLLIAAAAAVIFAIGLMKVSQKATFESVTRVVIPTLAIGLFMVTYLPENLIFIAYATVFSSMSITTIFIWVSGILYGPKTDEGMQRSLGRPLGVHYLGAAVGSLMAPLLTLFDPTFIIFLLTVIVCSVVIFRSRNTSDQPPIIAQEYIDARALAFKSIAKKYGMTKRESEIFFLFASGRSSSYISKTCFISRNTVDTHLRHIYDKTGVRSKEGLIDLVEEEEQRLREEKGKPQGNKS